MSTIHNIHGDMTAGTSPLAATDEIAIYEASTGLSKKLTGALVLTGAQAPVATTAGATSLTVAATTHGNRVILLSNSTPIAITMPAATGSGIKYTFVFDVAATATASTISRATSGEKFHGVAMILATATFMSGFLATSTDNTMTFNGTSKGGVIGDMVEFVDIKTGIFEVQYRSGAGVAPLTPFSNT